MSERTRNGKESGQDWIGFLFCLVGGFFAVSIVLLLNGQESKASVRAFTWPVLELVRLLGAPSALVVSLGLAALGSWLFLRPTPLAALRPLVALVVSTLGLTLVLGAFGAGGALGAWLPGLVLGLAGRTLAAVLGIALAWLGWTLFPALRAQRTNASDALRMGLSARNDSGAGVSSAEAALLVTEPRTPARPAAGREEPATRPASARDETLRPFTPPKEAPAKRAEPAPVRPLGVAAAPAVRPLAPEPARPEPVRAEAPALEDVVPPSPTWESAEDTLPLEPEAPFEEPEASWQSESELADDEDDDVLARGGERAPLAEAGADPFARLDEGVAASEEAAPAPAFAAEFDAEDEEGAPEDLEEDDLTVEEDESDVPLTAALAEEFETEEFDEEEPELASGADLDALLEAGESAEEVAPAPEALRASWEQVGLFDEAAEEEEEPEEPAEEGAAIPARAGRGDLTPTFDFDSGAPQRVTHEPELGEAAPAAATAPTPARAEAPRKAELPVAAKAPAPIAPAPDFLLKPTPAPAPKPAPKSPRTTSPKASAPKPAPVVEPVTPDESGEGWSRIVYEAGCAILEQQRVAVSMLERRFGLDFDSACRVLDELQAAGLIGPYMGGRTRDILLTREEWLPHAPHAS